MRDRTNLSVLQVIELLGLQREILHIVAALPRPAGLTITLDLILYLLGMLQWYCLWKAEAETGLTRFMYRGLGKLVCYAHKSFSFLQGCLYLEWALLR